MNNKPYAFAVVQGEDGLENVSLQFDHPEMCGQKYRQAIPLFTHPSDLTDEESLSALIYEMLCDHELCPPKGCHWEGFIACEIAKAILRKASEK